MMTISKIYEKEEQFDKRENLLRRLVGKYELCLSYDSYADYTGWFVHTEGGFLGLGRRNVICISNFHLKPDSVIEILARGYEAVAKEIQKFLKSNTNRES